MPAIMVTGPTVTQNSPSLRSLWSVHWLAAWLSFWSRPEKLLCQRSKVRHDASKQCCTCCSEALLWLICGWFLFLAMYDCECLTLKAADKRRLAAFEMTGWRHIKNPPRQLDVVQNQHVSPDPKRDFMTAVRRQKQKFFGHIVRAQNLATSILHGRVGGVRGRGRPRRRWMDVIKDWIGLSAAECVKSAHKRQQWRELVWSSSTVSDLQQWSRSEERRRRRRLLYEFPMILHHWKRMANFDPNLTQMIK